MNQDYMESLLKSVESCQTKRIMRLMRIRLTRKIRRISITSQIWGINRLRLIKEKKNQSDKKNWSNKTNELN